ncbi:MAG: hypothetical protein Q8L86_12535 [Vicinamibacterales bacterium]|nr:hypothetical protein [Vicinamibacterales bacterium]
MAEALKNFFRGLVNRYEAQSIPRGSASNSLNWKTEGDKIVLRGGSRALGGSSSTTGKCWIHVAKKADGTDLLVRKRGRKLEYYDANNDQWLENGTNIFPAAAADDEPCFDNYNSLAGAQMFVSTPNGGVFKIMCANPGSYTDLGETTFRGKFRIKNSRTFLWQRQDSSGRKDLTGLYGSYIDKDEISDYTQIAAEVLGSGNGVLVTFSGTLAFKAAGTVRTCFAITITDGTETFVDNYDGTLTGSAGGTGTINYTTGEWSVTFAVAPANTPNNVTGTYYWENSKSAGIWDFSKSAPRTAGQGFVLRQDDGGGKFQAVMGYRDVEYGLHERKTWATTLTNDDTNATNLPFRSKVGIPNWRAAFETGDGIIYVDTAEDDDPQVRLLTLEFGSTEVVPKAISDQLDLSAFLFDKAVVHEHGSIVAIACRTSDSTENNRLLTLDRKLRDKGSPGSWDVHDFYACSLAVYDGMLVAGDSVTESVFELFSGLDDDEAQIANFWDSNLDSVDTEDLKKVKRYKLQGAIGPDQVLHMLVSIDNGPFVYVGSIEGDGPYVDRGQRVSVGAPTLGTTEIGGGGSVEDDVVAYNYEREFTLRLDRLEQMKVRFQSTALGYASVSLMQPKDVRRKGRKVPRKYRGS